jgi:BirA family biotin operon repressor/biotin-[acetyl-CoA-carboxylase] ligase
MIVSERVRTVIAARTAFGPVYEWSKIDSTNRWLLAAAARGAPSGAVALADQQTAGRGRLQRTWEAPAGTGLLCSVLQRPQHLAPERRHLLSAAVGLAAQAACVEVARFRPDLKWPNDLEMRGAKLAGVLAQAEGPAVVVGIGCNVSWSPPGATDVATCAGVAVERGELLAALLVALDGLLGEPLDALAARYRSACATVGRDVRVELPGAVLEGRAEGLDDDGRLLVRPWVGTSLQAVAVGDVVHLRLGGGEEAQASGPASG